MVNSCANDKKGKVLDNEVHKQPKSLNYIPWIKINGEVTKEEVIISSTDNKDKDFNIDLFQNVTTKIVEEFCHESNIVDEEEKQNDEDPDDYFQDIIDDQVKIVKKLCNLNSANRIKQRFFLTFLYFLLKYSEFIFIL